MRIPQPIGTRGSLRWIQELIFYHPTHLNTHLQTAGLLAPSVTVNWVSPREDDERAEYRDSSFLTRIGQPELRKALKTFWPRRGPQWDALATTSAGQVILVEAKAHVGELASTCQASHPSRERIQRAFHATREALGIPSTETWFGGYYQYANRLAHLHFLRAAGVDAWLVFLYFNKSDMRGPASQSEWEPHLNQVYTHLGLANPGSIPGVANIFIDLPLPVRPIK